MSDAAGLKQFMSAWAEITQGASKPSIPPVWHRELLMARDPPRITCNHYEYEQVPNITEEETTNMVHRSFFFGPTDIDAIRRLVPFRECTTFDAITSCYWYCRMKALQLEDEEEVCMMCLVNARARFNPPLSVGYYGNCLAFPAAVTTAGKLCKNPFGDVVDLIRKTKNKVTEEYMHSVADHMVIKGRCLFTARKSCFVSDLTRAKLREVNFGWGEALYGGVARGGAGLYSGVTFIIPCKNAKGEEGVVLPICLPMEAMKRFTKVLDDMLGK